MDIEAIKVLDDQFGHKNNTPKTMEKLENDKEVQQIVERVFNGAKKIKADDIYHASKNSIVRDLLYNYAYNNLEFEDVEEIGDTNMSNFQLYKHDMGAFPLLTREQEYKYGRMIKDGNPAEVKEGINALVSHNLRLVISIAKRYKSSTIEFQDLVQEGNLGLMKAAEKYDVDTGNRFTTYATWWVQQAIGRYIECNDRSIRLPVHRHTVLRNLRYDKKKFIDKYCKEPTTEELAKFISQNNPNRYISQAIKNITKSCPEIPENKRKFYKEKYEGYSPLSIISNIPKNNGRYQIKRVISKYGKIYDLNFKKDAKQLIEDACFEEIKNLEYDKQGIISLNKDINDDPLESDELIDFVVDEKESVNPEANIEKKDLTKIIAEFLEKEQLPLRSKEILRLRYGLALDGPMDEEAICEMFEYYDKPKQKIIRSKEQVSVDIKKAEKILKKYPEEAGYVISGEIEKSRLNTYQQELIALKYGVTTGEVKKLEEIGEIFLITRERVRQIENSVVDSLQHNLKFKRKTKNYLK